MMTNLFPTNTKLIQIIQIMLTNLISSQFISQRGDCLTRTHYISSI